MFELREGDLNSTIEKSFKIAVHYFQFVNQQLLELLKYNENLIEDLAVDAIAPLFVKNGSVDLQIETAFRNWHPSIRTEDEFNFFLNKIVGNRVEHHLIKIFRESDPLFDTIYNSINYLVKKNRNGKTKYLGTVYITESGTKKINGKTISQEDFYSIPGQKFSDDRNLLQNLFFHIKTETEYFPAIPLNALVLRFKELKSSGYNFVEKVESPVKTYVLNEFINRGLVTAKDKLDNFYLRKGKLSKEDAQKVFEALKEVCEDLKGAGVARGLYDYLDCYYETLSVEEYKRKFQNILESLFKLIRITIANELKK